MPRVVLAALVVALAAAPAAAATPAVEVVAPSGHVVASADAGRFAYPAGGSLVRIGNASVTAAGVELHDVALLAGRVSATRIFVPTHGQAARIDGLVVDGRQVPVRVNGLVPLAGVGYLVTAQAAVASSGKLGLVGVRLTFTARAYGAAPGTQLVVGLPAAPSSTPATPTAPAASKSAPGPLDLLGFTGPDNPALARFAAAPFVVGDGVGAQAASIAERFLGVPYVWGGADPSTGFDCSGLVMFVYARLGVDLTHYSGAQYDEGMPVPPGQLRAGDLVFFHASPRGPQHVGIYLGDREFVHAPHTGDVVRISSLDDPEYALGYAGAVRPYS
jgi:cell wall-associated NlpC family hydrolase